MEVKVHLSFDGHPAGEFRIRRGQTVYDVILIAFPTLRTHDDVFYLGDTPGRLDFVVNNVLIESKSARDFPLTDNESVIKLYFYPGIHYSGGKLCETPQESTKTF